MQMQDSNFYFTYHLGLYMYGSVGLLQIRVALDIQRCDIRQPDFWMDR
jgi:hypothetical protein